MSVRNVALFSFAGFAVAAAAAPAEAQFGGLQRTLFRNLGFGLEPDLISTPQNGPLFNFNNFHQRLEYDRVADGYSYEFYRFFGEDSYGEDTFLDLGAFKLELTPDLTLNQSQQTGFHGRVGYSTRTIPEVHFLAETGQRAFNQFSGVSTFSKEPIRYVATLDAGVQKYEWTGNMQIDSEGSINALGFYDFNLRLVNVGGFTADGVLVEDEQVTDFDTGPIDLSGHIGLDLIGSLLQADGNDLAAAPPRIFSAAAQKERTADELMGAMKEGEKLTEEEVQFMIEQMFIQAFMDDPIGFFLNGPQAALSQIEGLEIEMSPAGPEAGDAPTDSPEAVPEPGTLLLIGLTVTLAVFIRKRGGLALPALS
ncbi:MAG TPA: PEP-CTERM sorting domain-containing protein [Phycisphaerae bacterium]|nr:PEP-CTERM sorting domain-containing protein [Phycisphaerae bacterium]